jgi:hypothetical protein
MLVTGHKFFKRAVGFILPGIPTLFFLTGMAFASDAASDFNDAFSGYVSRMILALLLLGALAYAAAKFLPGKFGAAARGRVKVISAVNLGRDMLYIVKLGPEVVAFLSGRTGHAVLGRWPAEEWDDYEAALISPESLKPRGEAE